LPVFLIFLEKIKKTGNQTLFYFAAGGGEIIVPPTIYILDYFLKRTTALSSCARAT